MRACLSLLALAGCVHAASVAQPPAIASSTYDVAVAQASADRMVTTVYSLELVPDGRNVWTVRTLHTAGTWEEARDTLTFDSDHPDPAAPWPLLLHHAVASVPAAIQFSPDGSPVGMLEEKGWRMAGMDALTGLDLPPEALKAGEQLLDPAGLVRDLQRTFPGTPPVGMWSRQEPIAGLPAQRVERCTRQRSGGEVTWHCDGHVEAKTERARLYDTVSESVIVVDARGLKSLEGTYSGTLLLADARGDTVIDRPIAGRRLVERR